MANYVLLYSGGGMPTSDAERKQAMDAWGAWFGKLGDRIVDAGNPFGQASKNVSDGGAVHDGPIGTAATGYSILKADSLNQAADLAKACPVLKSGGKITVYEVHPAM
ncbi:MAG TPA: hypothetical protein VGG31_07475 [Candidatus Dormibacteraeota bacterium]